MRGIHYIITLLTPILIHNIAFAQRQTSQMSLKLGAIMPNVNFDNIYNYQSKKVSFSKFKDKLVILEFWSTSCTSCIELFPTMQILQNKFQSQLQIILVNGKTEVWKDNEVKTQHILDRLKLRTGITIELPIVFNSKELDNYFPYRTIPHEVWIKDNCIIAITGPEEVTASNIAAILDGRKIVMRSKNDVFIDLQKQKIQDLIYSGSWVKEKEPIGSIIYKGFIPGTGKITGRRRSEENSAMFVGWYATNLSLKELYKRAYQISIPDNRILIETRDSILFRNVDYLDTGKYSNVYSLDITTNPETFEMLVKEVQINLRSAFHFQVNFEKRKIKCLVVRNSRPLDNIFTKGGERSFSYDKIDLKKYVRNYSISDFIGEMNQYFFDTPLVNETSLQSPVDIDLPQVLSQENIVRCLKALGFEIKEEEKELDVVLIKDEN
jgi:thiol-disulfide isomerase/thioredoxin